MAVESHVEIAELQSAGTELQSTKETLQQLQTQLKSETEAKTSLQQETADLRRFSEEFTQKFGGGFIDPLSRSDAEAASPGGRAAREALAAAREGFLARVVAAAAAQSA